MQHKILCVYLKKIIVLNSLLIIFEILKEQHINNELDRYISSPKLEFEEDPLSYWKDVHKTYPYLSNLAKRYLCVCATSSSSECLFSASGNIVTPYRSSLKPEKVDMLTFLNKNL